MSWQGLWNLLKVGLIVFSHSTLESCWLYIFEGKADPILYKVWNVWYNNGSMCFINSILMIGGCSWAVFPCLIVWTFKSRQKGVISRGRVAG